MSDLNRRVAEALGWTNLHRDTYWYEEYDSDGWIETWFGTNPKSGSVQSQPVPDYEHDLNAAIGLIEAEGQYFSLYKWSGDAEWTAYFTMGSNASATNASAAAAVCEAWLALQTEREKAEQ